MTRKPWRTTRLGDLPEVWVVRWLREDGTAASRVHYSHRSAAEDLLARERDWRELRRGMPPRMYRLEVAAVVEDAPDLDEVRAVSAQQHGEVLWSWTADGVAARAVAPGWETSSDAECVESVADGSPEGPAADLLDPAEVRA